MRVTYDHLRDCLRCNKITIREKTRYRAVMRCARCGTNAATEGIPRDGTIVILMEKIDESDN